MEAIQPKLTSYKMVDDQIIGVMWSPRKIYWFFIGMSFIGVLIGASCWGYQIATGLGAANILHPACGALILRISYGGSESPIPGP